VIPTLSALLLLYIGWVCLQSYGAYTRRTHLLAKYRDDDLVEHILRHEAWAGQTEEQLVDALGPPPRKLAAYTGQFQIYSYDEIGTNRYRLNVIVRHGIVTGCFQHRDGDRVNQAAPIPSRD